MRSILCFKTYAASARMVDSKTRDACLLFYKKPLNHRFFLQEQKSIDGDVHARSVGDIFSEHMSTK